MKDYYKMKRAIMITAAAMAIGCTADIKPEDVRIAEYKDGKECAVSFTFDDGMKEHYTIVAPELEKRGFKGTFWLCGAWIHEDPQADTTHVTWDEVREMSQRGHEMSNHSWSHPYMTALSKEDALTEIIRNDEAITACTGIKPVTFCFPYNSFNDETVAMAMEGRIGARLKEFWFGGQHSPDEYLHKQIEDALAAGSWIAGMTHGINYGYDCYETDPSGFTRFLDYVKEREDRIWVDTFREVAAYTKAASAAEIKTETDGNRLVVTVELDQNPLLEGVMLTMEVATDGRITAEQDGQKIEILRKEGKAVFSFNPYGGNVIIK